ncbi:MAG: 3-oxoacyl-[acyl-carrier protein] reductase [Acidimicrobiia bacterium]|jgi:3-oxoacyl-[acyl-carrier protein] reductase|nr:3-oxoacyl-[acyl-carrier protein] reductase [Acidimicrobiia bacterium]
MPRLSKLNRSIAGRVAIVTGAASGMGRATAHLFADEGAKVAVVDRVADGVDAVVKEIDGAGGTARGYVLDVSEATAIPVVVEQLRADLGPIDILINNAGMSWPADLTSDNWEDSWALTFEVNLTAQARLIRACHADLVRNHDGRVVNIASTEGLGATKGMSPYTASKTGVIGLTRSLALEYGDSGVTVNCICPGPIRTGMTEAIPDAAKDKFARRRVPLRRYGDPEEVAQITLSLVLPAASYLNGAIIPVDGGMIAQNT